MAYDFSKHKNDSWFKKIVKSHNPDDLSELIKKRLDNPYLNGPTVNSTAGENKIDIILALLAENDIFHNKLENAIGLLLFKYTNKELHADYDIIKHLFLIIKNAELKNCARLVFIWLKKNEGLLNDTFNSLASIKTALGAFARIQPSRDKEIEDYWFDLWRGERKEAWFSSFVGLRRQNPNVAANEIQLLLERTESEKATSLLIGFWSDQNSRRFFEAAMKPGLINKQTWSALVINNMMEKLDYDNKELLMKHMKGLLK